MHELRAIPRQKWVLVSAAAMGALLTPCLGMAGGVWKSSGPYGSKELGIVPLAVDPQSSSTVYAAASDRGIFKSTDGGRTWFTASAGLPVSSVKAIAVDRTNPARLYAGIYGGGVYTFPDFGATWTAMNTGLTSLYKQVISLAVDPGNPAILYAGTYGDGVFKSVNAGLSWASISNGITYPVVQTIAVDPSNPARLYAGTIGGVYRSTDGGAVWVLVNGANARALGIDPTNPGTVYAATYASGVLKSTDAGSSWTPTNTGLTNLDLYAMALDSTNPSVLYVGTFGGGVFKSTNAGAAWRAVNAGLSGTFSLNISSLVVDPLAPATVYLGSSRSFKSNDSGESWTAIAQPTIGDVASLARHPSDPSIVFAGTNGSGLFRSSDSGGSWTAANAGFLNIDFQTVNAIVFDPASPTTLYFGSGHSLGVSGVYKSVDSGSTWTPARDGLPNAWVNASAIDPLAPSTLYAGTGSGIYKSGNAGGVWAPIGSGVLGGAPSIAAIGINPVTPATLYVSSYDRVFKSLDGGAVWAFADSGLPSPTAGVTSLVVDPAAPTTVFAGANDGFYKSIDSGATWTRSSTGLPTGLYGVRSIALSPTQPGTLHVGMFDAGVFTSSDAGVTWIPSNAGLQNLWVAALAVNASGTTLHAGLYHGGAWRLRAAVGTFHTIVPCRAADTRGADGPAVAASSARSFKMVGRCGIPDDADGVSLNITMTDGTTAGHLRLHPGNTTLPTTSIMNFSTGQTRANNAVSRLGAGGDVTLFSGQGSGSVHVILDVNGYFR